MSQDDKFAYYVYGITSSAIGWGAMPGVEGGEPVYALPYEKIQAVVSRVPLDSFGPTTLPVKIKDTTWLQEKVLAHERVVRTVFAGHTIIPTKFGTLFENEEKVQTMLGEYMSKFLLLLAYLEDKEEWGIKIFANRERLREEIQLHDETIKVQRANLAQKGAGAAYLLQKKMDDQIAARVEQALADYSQAAYAKLLVQAVEGCILRLLASELTGRKEEMILHAAFLIRREDASLFGEEVEHLEAEHSWWQVDCTGPWAPYNFLEGCAEAMNV